MRPLGRAPALIAVALAGVAGSARADEASADVATARQLAVEGIKLAEQGECALAIDRLARAEKLHHAPTVLEPLGECQVQTGKVVEGIESLRRVTREALAPNAPAPFKRAQARAHKALARAEAKLGHLTIAVTAPPQTDVHVRVDDEPLAVALLGIERPSNPGEHVVVASAPGMHEARGKVTIVEGAHESLTLVLEPSSLAAGEQPRAEAPRAEPAASPGRRTAAYVAFGAGGVGLVVGTAFGLMAMSARSDLDARCTDKVCPPGSQGDIDAARTKGTLATIGFVGAGLGAALGAVLLFTAPPAQPSASARVTPLVGPTGGGVRVEF